MEVGIYHVLFSSLVAFVILLPFLGRADQGSDRPLQQIEALTKISVSVLHVENLTQEKASDTTEIKNLREKLRNSIDFYRTMLADLRKKYGPWIESENRAEKLRVKIQNTKNKGIGETLADQWMLQAYEARSYYYAPKGSKGLLDKWIDESKLAASETAISVYAEQIQEELIKALGR